MPRRRSCTPTRYALVTGQYAWRNPAGASILSGEAPLAIDPAKPTLPAILKRAGYTTGVVGKWHIGLGKGDLDYNAEIKPGPLEVGFDYAFFFPATGSRFWPAGQANPARDRVRASSFCPIDMMATFAAVAGQELPPDAGPDSFNVLPALLGEKPDKPVRDHLVHQTNGRGGWRFANPPAAGRDAKPGPGDHRDPLTTVKVYRQPPTSPPRIAPGVGRRRLTKAESDVGFP